MVEPVPNRSIFTEADLDTYSFCLGVTEDDTLPGLERLSRRQRLHRDGHWSKPNESQPTRWLGHPALHLRRRDSNRRPGGLATSLFISGGGTRTADPVAWPPRSSSIRKTLLPT
jgi:hypothetical protein